jgi:YggT family protein
VTTYYLARVINIIFQVFIVLIFVDVIGSWLVYARVRLPEWLFGIFQGVNSITSVVLNPIRRVIPNLGGLDLSPLIALVLLDLLRRWIVSALLR